MTKEEIAERFPAAVLIAREYRTVFGHEVRLTYARESGAEFGKATPSGDAAAPCARPPIDFRFLVSPRAGGKPDQG